MDPAQAVLTAPAPEGLSRLASAIGNGCHVVSGPSIGGGVAAKTHRLTLYETDGTERSLVLKRYPVGNDAPQLEWERLGCASRVSLPTPERVALDQSGSWFGEPALVMTMLPGEVDMFPSDVDDWTRQLAAALATIHETDLGSDVPAVVRRPHLVTRWRLWDIEPDERINAAVAAIRRLQSEAIIEPEVFCHNDYHPGNVLFEGGILRGVVDWSLARLAPAAADVSNARVELAIAPGGNTPQQFLGHYRKVSNAPLDRVALWDVLSGMHALEHSHRWIEAFAAVGVVRRPDEIRASVEQFLDDALSRC